MSRKGRIQSIVEFSQLEASGKDFTVDHLYDIRSAVICLLDAIASIIERQNGDFPESYFDITQQIFALDEKLFQGLRKRYLWWSSSFADTVGSTKSIRNLVQSAKPRIQTTSHHGFAIKYTRVESDRFLQSLMTAFDACKEALLQSLKRRSEKETSLQRQVLALKDEIKKQNTELVLTHSKLDESRREKNAWLARLDKMNQDLSDAERKISQLERNSHVVQWQKKMDETYNQHILEIDEVKTSSENERKQHEEMRDALVNKVKKLEAEVGKLRLRCKIPVSPSPSSLVEKLEHVKQHVYLRDQEIYSLHKELSDQQREVVGWLNGLQKDFKHLLDKMEHENPSKAFSPDANYLKFQAIMNYLHETCMKGNVTAASESLPSQYAPVQADAVSPIQRGRKSHLTAVQSKTLQETQGTQNTRPSLLLRTSSLNGRLSPALGKSPPVVPAIRLEVHRPHTVSSEILRSASACSADSSKWTNSTLPIPSNAAIQEGNKPALHPKLVNQATGRADLLQVMKHFPYLTPEQVSEQWENFRRYDKNHDFNLDLPELYEVITNVCGLKVTVGEMKEAMLEVDRNHSNNIDFYEYLKIAEMIMRKQGKAAIFQSDMLREQAATTSRLCLIQ